MGKKDKQNDSLDWIKSTGEEAGASADDSSVEPVSGDVVLEGSLGIAEAEPMHRQLLAVLDAQVDISIASEQLSRVDAAGVQLLYGFVKEAKARSIDLKWMSVSDALLEAATALGLNDNMGFAADV